MFTFSFLCHAHTIKLHMPRRQRFAVACLFALGIIVTVAGIVRTWFIYKSLMTTYDNTWYVQCRFTFPTTLWLIKLRYAYPLWIAAAVEIDLGVICASAPVLKPLLSKIPFSLSATFSGGISLKKKSTGYGYNSKASKMSSTVAEGSHNQLSATTNTSSKRRSEAIRAVPDLDHDQGRSYELKNWDEECAIASPEPVEQTRRTQSHDAILSAERSNEETGGGGGFTRIWQKMRTRGSESSGSNEDMTITMTSEIELSNEPASAYASKHNSRHDDAFRQHRAAKDHKSPSPQQSNQGGYF